MGKKSWNKWLRLILVATMALMMLLGTGSTAAAVAFWSTRGNNVQVTEVGLEIASDLLLAGAVYSSSTHGTDCVSVETPTQDCTVKTLSGLTGMALNCRKTADIGFHLGMSI